MIDRFPPLRRIFSRRFLSVLALPVLLALPFVSCGTYGRMVRHGLSGVYDYKFFHGRPVAAGSEASVFRDASAGRRIEPFVTLSDGRRSDLDGLLRGTGTIAFLVAQEDGLIYERYFHGRSPSDISMTFSMSKSVTGLLVFCALDDGLIGSLEDPVTRYIPELMDAGMERITLAHLLNMTSGLDYVESDNPFGLHARLYYCEECIENSVLGFRPAEPPGTRFLYKSGDTMMLAVALRRALGGETLASYLERRVWKPMGMEHDAIWVTDGDLEKSWCGVTAAPRDLARLGLLYLNGGVWRGRRIVSERWIARATGPVEGLGSPPEYHLAWWRPFPGRTHYMMAGHLGQYVYVNPDTRTVAVRLGTGTGGLDFKQWQAILASVTDSVRPAASP